MQASDQDPWRDTLGGPITVNRMVPCWWQIPLRAVSWSWQATFVH